MNSKKNKVVVAFSGGVDSAVAAALLKKQGNDVTCVFMKNWSGDSGKSPCWIDDYRDALQVSAHLKLAFVIFDFEKEFRKEIAEYTFREYKNGRTPNPDVVCNKIIKFNLFIKEAKKLGANLIATGHYARIKRDSIGLAHLLRGLDSEKDQSYFLNQLSQEQLKSVIFPIGEFKKEQIRQIAKEYGISVANKRSSRGICFVGKVPIFSFLKERLPSKKGNVIDTDGNLLGTHEGIQYFTIGQRHGLSIVSNKKPYFIVEKNPKTNIIKVALGDNHPLLFSKKCIVKKINWIACEPRLPFECEVQIRYRQKANPATISRNNNDEYCITFEIPQRAIAPGQFAVFYSGDECLGGGVIEMTIK